MNKIQVPEKVGNWLLKRISEIHMIRRIIETLFTTLQYKVVQGPEQHWYIIYFMTIFKHIHDTFIL